MLAGHGQGLSRIMATFAVTVLLCLPSPRVESFQSLITDDFNFGTWSPFMSQWVKSVPVCVWDESGEPSTFQVSANGFGASNQFALVNDVQDRIVYKVTWQDGTRPLGKQQLTPFTTLNQIVSSTDSSRCASGPTGLLEVSIDAEALSRAAPGLYSDTVVLTISPL